MNMYSKILKESDSQKFNPGDIVSINNDYEWMDGKSKNFKTTIVKQATDEERKANNLYNPNVDAYWVKREYTGDEESIPKEEISYYPINKIKLFEGIDCNKIQKESEEIPEMPDDPKEQVKWFSKYFDCDDFDEILDTLSTLEVYDQDGEYDNLKEYIYNTINEEGYTFDKYKHLFEGIDCSNIQKESVFDSNVSRITTVAKNYDELPDKKSFNSLDEEIADYCHDYDHYEFSDNGGDIDDLIREVEEDGAYGYPVVKDYLERIVSEDEGTSEDVSKAKELIEKINKIDFKENETLKESYDVVNVLDTVIFDLEGLIEDISVDKLTNGNEILKRIKQILSNVKDNMKENL